MLGSVAEMAAAQIQYGAPLNTGQAREASFRIVPISRYAPMLSNRTRKLLPDIPTPIMAGLSPKTDPVWIPATIRPAAPDVKELAPTFIWTDADVSAGETAVRLTSSLIRSTSIAPGPATTVVQHRRARAGRNRLLATGDSGSPPKHLAPARTMNLRCPPARP